MGFLKNYLFILGALLVLVLITKLTFIFLLYPNFAHYLASDILYALFLGLRFDLALSAIATFVICLFAFELKIFRGFFWIIASIIWLIQLGDIIYFQEAQRHIGYEIKDIFVDSVSLIQTALSKQFFLFVTAIISTVGLWFIALYLPLVAVALDKKFILKIFTLCLITLFFARGMFVKIPLNPWQANQIGDTTLANIVLNGGYSVIYSLTKNNDKLNQIPIKGFVTKENNELIASLYQPKQTKNTYQTLNRPNIVFIFLESWPANKMQSYGYSQAITPFFDTLLQKSIRPKAMIANGHRTTEGMFAAMASFPNPLGATIAKTDLQSSRYITIIDILKSKGYQASFFQGSSKETSGTGSFAQTLGFTNSYGKEEITNPQFEHNNWGVYDQDLYRFVSQQTSKNTQPFVIGINTNTTHDTKIPHTIKPLPFSDNEAQNRRLNALNFADAALKDFVQSFEKQHPNTLFVLFSDHTAGVSEGTFENYLIPCLIYHHELKPQLFDTYISQRDIAPSVLDIVGLDYKKYAPHFSGKSLMQDEDFFADFWSNGSLGWVSDKTYLQINPFEHKTTCFDVSGFTPKPKPCDKQTQIKQALAFTKTTQDLLFGRKTTEFAAIRIQNRK